MSVTVVSQLISGNVVGLTVPLPIDEDVKEYFFFSKIAVNEVSFCIVTVIELALEKIDLSARSQCLNW